ncbi:MAG: hypothetical protein ACREOQ_00750 [Gemmatimonadales bacterium]
MAKIAFQGDIADFNRDLQQLHFRRAPLASSGAIRAAVVSV